MPNYCRHSNNVKLVVDYWRLKTVCYKTRSDVVIFKNFLKHIHRPKTFWKIRVCILFQLRPFFNVSKVAISQTKIYKNLCILLHILIYQKKHSVWCAAFASHNYKNQYIKKISYEFFGWRQQKYQRKNISSLAEQYFSITICYIWYLPSDQTIIMVK
jgi:hypothetical protein